MHRTNSLELGNLHRIRVAVFLAQLGITYGLNLYINTISLHYVRRVAMIVERNRSLQGDIYLNEKLEWKYAVFKSRIQHFWQHKIKAKYSGPVTKMSNIIRSR